MHDHPLQQYSFVKLLTKTWKRRPRK